MSSRTIVDLREKMFDVLDGLESGKVTVEQAKAVAGVAQVIVNTAKIEADLITHMGKGVSSTFIPVETEPPAVETSTTKQGGVVAKSKAEPVMHPGYLGTTVHRMGS